MILILVFCSLILTTRGVTFENVTVILKWSSTTKITSTIRIPSDNSLKRYVGEFGEVLINDQKIPQLEILSVSNLPKVTHLHLTNCGIRRIKPGAFQNLPSLTDLNLSGNLLEKIEDGVFDNLKFETLYLENNKISKIGDTAFINLGMKYLFIDDNRISEWKSEWFFGTPLEAISMGNNLLQRLPRLSFEHLWHFAKDVILINFILNNNKLNYIDPDAFKGVKIICSLGLQNNSLTYLEPGSFDSVEKIDQIDLSGNLLTDIYYEVFRNTKITHVNLYNNFLTCLSMDIFNSTEVASVNVGNNPISCTCVKKWTDWRKRNKSPEISNFQNLNKTCRSSASVTFVEFHFVLFVFVALFL